MRRLAGLALLCLVVAGCKHLPDEVTVDVGRGTVAVGPCVCRLPLPANATEPSGDEPR